MVSGEQMAIKTNAEAAEARRIYICGTVQGVGFRPHVYRTARRVGVKGCVYNDGDGVVIEAEAPPSIMECFIDAIVENLPDLAHISSLQEETLERRGYEGFSIGPSQKREPAAISLPADIAVCPLCREETGQPGQRRYQYPFTNCTNCGPRFTIINELPYDRLNTSMCRFEMCALCRQEYSDPADRRFHAQPIACPDCGPSIYALNRQGKRMPGNWLYTARQTLLQGGIVAVKGLGGFHLACNARDAGPLRKLRQRKSRPSKPFAVMVRDLGAARRYVKCSPETEMLLASPSSPIVVLPRCASSPLPAELAPGMHTLGVMLPYTPLHELLFPPGLDILVMTSGNRGNLPLVKDDHAALQQLGEFADLFLLHNREIINRCDDSVVTLLPAAENKHGKQKERADHPGMQSRTLFLRRSRGFVPEGFFVPAPPAVPPVLGGGAEKKNTFCILKDEKAYLSQHHGEMEFREGWEAYLKAYRNWCRLLRSEPGLLGFDPHPQYQVTKELLQLPWSHRYPVQHHHAHLAAVMGEYGLKEKVLGAILDGTGWGDDGAGWGFEILCGNLLEYKRIGHMKYLPLPGGDRATREPWRTALALLHQAKGKAYAVSLAPQLFGITVSKAETIVGMVESGFNSPPVSSGGRLFDAAAAILGLCCRSTYEGEAAILLAEAACHGQPEAALSAIPYHFTIEKGEINFAPTAAAMAAGRLKGEDARSAAVRFHLTVATAVHRALLSGRSETGINKVVLGGGVWQNNFLTSLTATLLQCSNFTVYVPRRIPPGDGGLSLGQALVAAWRWSENVPGSAG